jgi:hypothetical protein
MTVACPESTRIALCLQRSKSVHPRKITIASTATALCHVAPPSHGVPWSCITRHLTFLPDSRPCAASRPHHVVLMFESTTDPRSPDRVANAARFMSDEQHFLCVPTSRVADFSRTEKLKIDRLPSIRDGDRLFSPQLFDNLELLPASSLQQMLAGSSLGIYGSLLGHKDLVKKIVDENQVPQSSKNKARNYSELSLWTAGPSLVRREYDNQFNAITEIDRICQVSVQSCA